MDYLIKNIGIVNITILILNAFILILLVYVYIKFCRNTKRYKSLMKKLSNGINLEEMISKYISSCELIENDNKIIKEQIVDIQNQLKYCTQKVGFVRYNAFSDTGSDLSFAVALLDDENTGIILNGVYSREVSNIYAKQVIKGEAKNNLSEEEKQALNKAINYEKI